MLYRGWKLLLFAFVVRVDYIISFAQMTLGRLTQPAAAALEHRRHQACSSFAVAVGLGAYCFDSWLGQAVYRRLWDLWGFWQARLEPWVEQVRM
jgi:hypothetical protein